MSDSPKESVLQGKGAREHKKEGNGRAQHGT